ncbi:alpha/beta hydrolase [Rudaea sp.]|uniref:alpha/beta fold hydrolase n=1 Tax=Rudaea sp. TaxID=2136325 RepID=UPI00322040FF
MKRSLLAVTAAVFTLPLAALVPRCAGAAVQPFPAGFRVVEAKTADATIHLRIGGKGPAVLMLHGFGDTGDMWQPLAVRLMRNHTVIVPDLRGMGLSSHPDGGYEKKAQAKELAGVLDNLSIGPVALVTHDIGNMVGYAFAAQYRPRTTRWVAMDAPLPGIGEIWDAQFRNPKTWHFNFRGPDVERLVAGRERILLDRFYNELSANPAAIDESTRQHYAELYALPHAIHDAFEQFAAFAQDGTDNRAFLAEGKLKMPVLAVGADHSYGSVEADDLRLVADDVSGAIIVNSGHWIMEEQPAQAVEAIAAFLDRK